MKRGEGDIWYWPEIALEMGIHQNTKSRWFGAQGLQWITIVLTRAQLCDKKRTGEID